MSVLRGLGAGVRSLIINPAFRRGLERTIPVEAFIEDLSFGRTIDLVPVRAVLQEAKSRYPNSEKSDAWVAPRLHASLRLTRREAADKRLWSYLTIVEFPEYVWWRFLDADTPEQQVPVDRFMGEDSKNALARLWWAAELTRNGKDYGPSEQASQLVQFFNRWLPMDFMHHRPAALAATRFMKQFNDGRGVTDAQSELLAKAFNLLRTTLSLDALCQNPPVDVDSVRDWCNEAVDETKMMDELPEGPDEEPISGQSIGLVYDVLQRLAVDIDLANVKRRRRIRRVPVESSEDASEKEELVEVEA